MDEVFLTKDIAVQIQKRDGKIFHNIKYKVKQDGVFCKDKNNQVLTGFPRIIYREGDGKFGEEIYFQFWITGEKESYKANTKWENMEWYFSTTAGFEFLTTAVDYIKKLKSDKGVGYIA